MSISLLNPEIYIYIYIYIFYSCNAVIKLSGKIPSQALLLYFPECLHSIRFINMQ